MSSLSDISPESSIVTGDLELAAEAGDRPEKNAQQHTYEDRSCQRKGDRPSPAAPVEIAWKTAERQIEAVEPQDHQTGDYQEEAERNKNATEVMHTAEFH